MTLCNTAATAHADAPVSFGYTKGLFCLNNKSLLAPQRSLLILCNTAATAHGDAPGEHADDADSEGVVGDGCGRRGIGGYIDIYIYIHINVYVYIRMNL